MSWIRSTASDYKDLSDALVAAAVGNSVQSVDSVAAGGSGYAVGEIITLTGGTFTVAAQLEVLTLSTTAVATVRIYNAGVYTVDPTDPVAQGSSDGSGTGATFNLTLAANGWTANRNQATTCSSVDSVAAAGTGYNIGDVITLTGGVYDTAVTLTVATLTGGAGTGVATVTISEAGYYRVLPSDPVVQASVSPSGGTGATFNLSWDTGEREVILEGIGSGAEEIFVGWRTFSGSGYFNFELHGMTGYSAALQMSEQPGVSPGFFDGGTELLEAGAYMLCQNTTVSYWLSINSSRLILVVKAGSAYFNAYLGFGNRFATSIEYPYPMCVAGHDSHPFDLSSQSKLSSGLVDPWGSSENTLAGPMFVMGTDNAWISVQNAIISTTYSPRDIVVVSPAQVPDGSGNSLITPQADRFIDNSYDFASLILQSASGTPQFNVDPTPGTTPKHMMFPTAVVISVPTHVLIELDNTFWMTAFLAAGSLVTEDRIVDGTDTYRVFQNCNRTDVYAFLAIKEI
jgi:hypothetical protein